MRLEIEKDRWLERECFMEKKDFEKIKIVMCDVDGTLLTDNGIVSPKTLEVIRKVTDVLKKDWFAIVTCEIQGIFVDEKIMMDDSHIDTKKWKPLIYKFREYTSTGDRLGLNFNFQEV